MSRTWVTPGARRVPEVVLAFWVLKLLSTAMGEAASDGLVGTIGPAPAVLVGFVAFAVVLIRQLRLQRFVAGPYWLTVAMIGVFGTMAADVVHKGFGVAYSLSSIGYALALVVIFVVWHRVEGTLSIHSIDTTRRELFYWATVVATFAMGTAVGDLLAITFGLGYFSSGVVCCVLFAIPMMAYWRRRAPEVTTFWCAYILTRPLGASFADWAGKSPARGGLGWGDWPVALILAVLMVVVVRLTARGARGVVRERSFDRYSASD